ncbi:hypothetical protein JVT61DRAFT_3989 [Boletus reticuloceps]|uniref:Uncharacterized protein n=1 Tax=Boletus reticuloceps TaxID=495285 RepID=A0A8I3A7J4_9AGAM|nr:hypothetical protein JVT61DRAFT_3989 [Boletus reticuloceps]
MFAGVNCVLYGLCMFVLLRGAKTAPLRFMLVVMSTILFLLCTVHVGASLRQLLEAFVYAPTDVPYYSITYWLDLAAAPRVLKGFLFGTLVLAQDFILIWRLYVVFMCNWRVIILPIILAAGCVGSAYAASAVSTIPKDGLYSSTLTSLVISAWAFGFTLNASVTGSIVVRLWRLGRTMVLGATSSNRFASSIYIVIESGAISAIANAIMLAMFASNNPASLFVMDVAAQVTALTPLLIVVQVGHIGQDRISTTDLSKMVPKAQDVITFRAGQDSLPDTTQFRWASSASSTEV